MRFSSVLPSEGALSDSHQRAVSSENAGCPMFPFRSFNIRSFELGLLFRDGEFRGLMNPGRHRMFDPLNRICLQIVSQREPWLAHEQLDQIVRSGVLKDRAVVLDLQDHQRGLVWIDGRFSTVLLPGTYAYWTGQREVRTEIVDARSLRLQHEEMRTIAASPTASQALDLITVARDRSGLLYVDGQYRETLTSGMHAFWKGPAEVRVVEIDLREALVDITGQDLMTADKVTLRINATVTWRVTDARRAVTFTEDLRQTLYREAQLVLRSIISARELDVFLSEKGAVSRELGDGLKERAEQLGLAITSVGIRDVILPGEMKELMNRVTEAKKAAEANLIARREETAAMRSQANTARLLAENPTLMRLRELETLERIAAAGKLSILVGEKTAGEKGLAEKVIGLL